MEKLIDIDGNEYQTVQIGNQVWMAENLRVKHFRDGTPILHAPSHEDWLGASGKFAKSLPAWCSYNNELENENKYGLLYNYSVVNCKSVIAPEGWRVPEEKDFDNLFNYLGGKGQPYGFRLDPRKLKAKNEWWDNTLHINQSIISGETLILTSKGYVCIKNIYEGDELISLNNNTAKQELSKVIEVQKSKAFVIHIFNTSLGSMEVVEEAIFTLDDETLVEARELRAGCRIKTLTGYTDIERKRISIATTLIYNLKTTGDNNFFITNQDVMIQGIQEDLNIHNESGFSALPSGSRSTQLGPNLTELSWQQYQKALEESKTFDPITAFGGLGEECIFWTSGTGMKGYPMIICLTTSKDFVLVDYTEHIHSGKSIRLIKEN